MYRTLNNVEYLVMANNLYYSLPLSTFSTFSLPHSSSAEAHGPTDSMLAFTANAKGYSAYLSNTGAERKLKKTVADYRKSVKLGGLSIVRSPISLL
jgi:hypothetical protein